MMNTEKQKNPSRAKDEESARQARAVKEQQRRAAVRRAVAAGLTDFQIGKRLGMVTETAAKIRSELGLEQNTGSDL
jgi:DNA-binding NarL/FixJ family response regulator